MGIIHIFDFMRFVIVIFFSLAFLTLNAQSNQVEYLKGKKFFTEGNYREAMGSFQILTEDTEFGAYATFYYALAAYRQGMRNVAIDTWKQVATKYPSWDQNVEVNYWLAKVSFEQKNYLDAAKYSSLLSTELCGQVIDASISLVDLEELRKAYNVNESNKGLAYLYFKALSSQPYELRDQTMIRYLSSRYGFEVEEVLDEYTIVKKDKYSIALVLPFLFDSLQNPQSVIRNRIIYEMYQGIRLGRDSLKALGINLRLYPYDTYKSKERTQRLISRGVLDKADVIIGPLYSGPNEVMQEFSKKKEIPMINPLSSNGQAISENTNAFLFKPSYETQGIKAGEYAKKKFQRNKNAMVLFETERDKMVAEAYHRAIKDDFDIVLFDQITKEDALQLQLDFTEQYEESCDHLAKSQIDSISDIPGRFVRSKVRRDPGTGSIIRNDKGENTYSYYEMKFKIPRDTIGHIFAATSSNLLANNIISLSEVRGDSIGIIGYSNWLDFKIVSYNQMERLDIAMIHTALFNSNTTLVDERIRKTYCTEPTSYHYLGFELIMQLGNLLDKNGKYFQRGLVSGGYIDGLLMEGMKYGINRDNQVVPIVNMKNLNLNVQNKSLYEN